MTREPIESQPTASEIITTPAGQTPVGDIKSLSNEQILAELQALIGDTLQKLQRIVPLWRELQDRGLDLSHLRKGICFYVPLIIQGKVDAAMVARLASHAGLLRQAALLPMADQRRLAAGQKVKVLLARRREAPVAVEKDPLDLSGPQVRQVFGPQGIRSIEEQRDRLEARRSSSASASVEFDPELRTLNVAKVQVPLTRITKAIASKSRDIEGPPHEAQVRKTVNVAIPDKLHRALRARSAELDISVDQLLVKICWAAGIVES